MTKQRKEIDGCVREDSGLWTDTVDGTKFSLNDTYSNRNDGQAPFLTSTHEWFDSQRSRLPLMNAQGNCITPEGSYGELGQVEKYRDKRILIIGAGPSTELLTDEDVESHDFVWSCNHFYKHDKVGSLKLDLVSIGNEVNLSEVKENLGDNVTVALNFTVSRPQAIVEFVNFLNKGGERVFPYATRWFGRPGEVMRLGVLASLFGARDVSFIGSDGHSKEVLDSKMSDSVFEPGKTLKLSSYDHRLQLRQYILWTEYLQTIFPYVRIANLGSRCDQNQWRFISE